METPGNTFEIVIFLIIIYFSEKVAEIEHLRLQLAKSRQPGDGSTIRQQAPFEDLPARSRRRYCEPLSRDVKEMAEKLKCDSNQVIGHLLTW